VVEKEFVDKGTGCEETMWNLWRTLSSDVFKITSAIICMFLIGLYQWPWWSVHTKLVIPLQPLGDIEQVGFLRFNKTVYECTSPCPCPGNSPCLPAAMAAPLMARHSAPLMARHSAPLMARHSAPLMARTVLQERY
jgi:hypothetical protein